MGELRETGIGLVLFGLGRIGTIHAYNCLKNRRCELRYIVEYELIKTKEYVEKNRLHHVKVLHPDQMDEALDDPLVHGAIVGTITNTHKEIVLRCFAKGKAVLCEKPLAESLEEVALCYDEAEKRSLPLLCAFNRRFDPSHRKLREEAKAGKVGSIRVVKTCSRDYPVPPVSYLKVSGGMFHDCGIHDIDMIMWIVGEMPCKVYAQGSAFIPELREINDVDTVMITLTFPSGILGQIELGRYASFGYDQRVEVLGEQGMLESRNQSQSSVVHSDSHGISEDVLKYSFVKRYEESYEIELDHFFDMIEGKAPSSITRHDVLLAGRIVEMSELSFRSGQVLDVKL